MERGPIQPRKLIYRGLLSENSRRSSLVCSINPPFGRLSSKVGQVTHVLLTRAPLYRGRIPFSCDLHVLGAPLTFALSQDQTLHKNSACNTSLNRVHVAAFSIYRKGRILKLNGLFARHLLFFSTCLLKFQLKFCLTLSGGIE